jgi:hypothetical protein
MPLDAVAELVPFLRAVRNDAVIVLDPDISSRWGPRIVELLRSVVDATGMVRQSGPHGAPNRAGPGQPGSGAEGGTASLGAS